MALIVEDGMGVRAAEAYASVDYVDSYWSGRSHNALAADWVDAEQAEKEGAIREATAYLDALYSQKYRGVRAGDAQGLEWPRTMALSEGGWPLPDLPDELRRACAELATRALVDSLATDEDIVGSIKSLKEKVGPIEQSTDFGEAGASRYKKFGVVEEMLAPILDGTQETAGPSWGWR